MAGQNVHVPIGIFTCNQDTMVCTNIVNADVYKSKERSTNYQRKKQRCFRPREESGQERHHIAGHLSTRSLSQLQKVSILLPQE